jgi:hypothetical protein
MRDMVIDGIEVMDPPGRYIMPEPQRVAINRQLPQLKARVDALLPYAYTAKIELALHGSLYIEVIDTAGKTVCIVRLANHKTKKKNKRTYCYYYRNATHWKTFVRFAVTSIEDALMREKTRGNSAQIPGLLSIEKSIDKNVKSGDLEPFAGISAMEKKDMKLYLRLIERKNLRTKVTIEYPRNGNWVRHTVVEGISVWNAMHYEEVLWQDFESAGWIIDYDASMREYAERRACTGALLKKRGTVHPEGILL